MLYTGTARLLTKLIISIGVIQVWWFKNNWWILLLPRICFLPYHPYLNLYKWLRPLPYQLHRLHLLFFAFVFYGFYAFVKLLSLVTTSFIPQLAWSGVLQFSSASLQKIHKYLFYFYHNSWNQLRNLWFAPLSRPLTDFASYFSTSFSNNSQSLRVYNQLKPFSYHISNEFFHHSIMLYRLRNYNTLLS